MIKINPLFIILVLLIPFKIIPRMLFGFMDSEKTFTNILVLILLFILSFSSNIYGGTEKKVLDKIIFTVLVFVIYETITSL